MNRLCISSAALAAGIVSSLALFAPAAHAQSLTFNNGGLLTATRPTTGSTIVTLTGTFTNPATGSLGGASADAPFIAGTSSLLFTTFSSDFLAFLRNPVVNVPGGTYTGSLLDFTVMSTSPLGLYNVDQSGGTADLVLSFNNGGSVTRNFSVNVVAAQAGVPEPSAVVSAFAFAGLMGALVVRKRVAR